MYPISLGYAEAEQRIRRLIENGHHAEALLTSMFTFEKTLRRAIRYCALCRGFTSSQCNLLLNDQKFDNLSKFWACFSPQQDILSDRIGNVAWQKIKTAQTMRNKMVHGKRVYDLDECKVVAEDVVSAINIFRGILERDLGFDGWSTLPTRRKSILTWQPLKGGNAESASAEVRHDHGLPQPVS